MIAIVCGDLTWEEDFFFTVYPFVLFELFTVSVLLFQNFLKLVVVLKAYSPMVMANVNIRGNWVKSIWELS